MKRGLILAVGIFAIVGESAAYGSVNRLMAKKDSSFISYHVYHFFHSVDGISRNVSCSVNVDTSTQRIIEVSAETAVNTFNSGNETRDRNAMNAIESDKYPSVAFRSDSIVYNSDTTVSVTGKLAFHGVAKEIIIPITVISKLGETTCDGSIRLDFEIFNVERPALIFIPVGNSFIIKFHMVFESNL
ncbi:MAG: YceI family protein [Candidatus Kryptoniota bacterium]